MSSLPEAFWSWTPEKRRDYQDEIKRSMESFGGGLVSLLDPTGEVREPRQTLGDIFPDYTGPKTIAEQQGGATLGGADLTPEFQRYIESQGYNVQGHPMMADAGPLITKDGKDIFGALTQTDGEWGFKDTEPFRGPKPGEPGFGRPDVMLPEPPISPPMTSPVMPRPGGELPLVKPLGPSPDTRPPPVMPRPGMPGSGPTPGGGLPGRTLTGPNLVPRPGPGYGRLPTGREISRLTSSDDPAIRPPSIQLRNMRHGGSLTDTVLDILRSLS